MAMKGMVPFRAEMIVVAGILTEFVIEKFGVQQITQSAFALKEGVLWKMIQNEKVCCFEIAEVNPTLDKENLMAENTFEILQRVVSQLVY